MSRDDVVDGVRGGERGGRHGVDDASRRWTRGAFGIGAGLGLALAAASLAHDLLVFIGKWPVLANPDVVGIVSSALWSTGVSLGELAMVPSLIVGAYVGARNADRPRSAGLGIGAGVLVTTGAVGLACQGLGNVAPWVSGDPLRLQHIPHLAGTAAVAGGLAAGASVVTGRFVGQASPTSAFDRLRPGISPGVFGAVLVGVVGVLSGVVLLLQDRVIWYLGNGDELMSVAILVDEWRRFYFWELSAGAIVALVSGAAWSPRDQWRPAVGAGVAYVGLVGTAVLVAGRLTAEYDPFEVDVFILGSQGVGLVVATAVLGYLVSRWRSTHGVGSAPGQDRPARGSPRHRREPATGTKLGLFVGLPAVFGVGALVLGSLDVVVLKRYGDVLGAALFRVKSLALTLGVGAGVVYAAVHDAVPPARAAVTSLVGTTAGYLVVAFALFGLTAALDADFAGTVFDLVEILSEGGFPERRGAPSDRIDDASRVLSRVVTVLAPAVAVGGVAAVSAALTARVAGNRRGGEPRRRR